MEPSVGQLRRLRMMAVEMRMIRWMCGHTRLDRIKNEVFRDRVRVTPIVPSSVR